MISRPLTDEEINAGIWTCPVAKEGVAPIINKSNPYYEQLLNRGISPEEFQRLFTSGKTMTWGEILGNNAKEKVNVYVRADESGAADVFANFLFKNAADLKGIKVNGDEEMIRRIQDDKFSLGFCNFSYAFEVPAGGQKKDVQVVPVDLDYDNKIDRKEIPFKSLYEAHRGLWLGIYPKNLCRELVIGTLGKPSDQAITEFLKYLLSEGQSGIENSGLCKLNDVYIRYSQEKLK